MNLHNWQYAKNSDKNSGLNIQMFIHLVENLVILQIWHYSKDSDKNGSLTTNRNNERTSTHDHSYERGANTVLKNINPMDEIISSVNQWLLSLLPKGRGPDMLSRAPGWWSS